MNVHHFSLIAEQLAQLGFPQVTPDDKFAMFYYPVGLLNVDVRYVNGETRNATFVVADDDADSFTSVERFNPAAQSEATRLRYITAMAKSGISYGTIARIFDITVTTIRRLLESDQSSQSA